MHSLTRAADNPNGIGGMSLPAIYLRELKAAGFEGPHAPDPVGKLVDDKREKLIELARRASLHDDYIRRHYRGPLNRLINIYLEPLKVTYHLHLDYYYYTDFQLNISVDSLKQVLPILRLLSHEGLRITTRPAVGGGEQTKTWNLRPRRVGDDEEGPALALNVSAKQCERVKVGEETVTKPIYETRCNWNEDQKEVKSGS